MKYKAQELVYLDSDRYISLELLKYLYIAIGLISFIIFGYGVGGKVTVPIVLILAWNVLYMTFIIVLKSDKVEKTFSLRYLVNGIASLFMSSLFFILLMAILCVNDSIDKSIMLWVAAFFVIFIVIYFLLIVIGVHRGTYSRIKVKSKDRNFVKISYISTLLIPLSGTIGLFLSKLSRNHESESLRGNLVIVGCILLIFLPALGTINFIQYFYCKKYAIQCDERGNFSSPLLEPSKKNGKTNRAVFTKVLLITLSIMASFFLVFILIGIFA